MLILGFVLVFWTILLLALWHRQKALFLRTWNEPYFAIPLIAIESDDWGPGGPDDAARLTELLNMLSRHRDCRGQPAILTANVVLSVPDTQAIRESGFKQIKRRYLDTDFPEITVAMHKGMSDHSFRPQLHGLEHLYTPGLIKLAQANDPTALAVFDQPNWWDWESLPSPWQAHYVDGTQLPTTALPSPERAAIIAEAMQIFERCFGFVPDTTVAPCYLWDADVEAIWLKHGIHGIQTLGYRCPGRDAAGHYWRDMDLIRPGERSHSGQSYMVRNVMYEPADGKSISLCKAQIKLAKLQALPIIFTTHRYNYTRSAALHEKAIAGLNELLSDLENRNSNILYCASDRLVYYITQPSTKLMRQGLHKINPFVLRLLIRHAKLRIGILITGIFIPLSVLLVLFAVLNQIILDKSHICRCQ